MTGALVAIAIRQPYLALPVAFASHFLCDALPHFGFKDQDVFKNKFNIVLGLDFGTALVAMAIMGVLYPSQAGLVWACMILAASPDLMWLYYRGYIERIKFQPLVLDPISRFHAWVQWSQTLPGLIVEVAWFILTGTIILLVR